MGCDEVLEVRRADLFLTLDEHLDADRGAAPAALGDGGVRDDPTLIVGCAPPVETPIALHWHEWLSGPLRIGSGGWTSWWA